MNTKPAGFLTAFLLLLLAACAGNKQTTATHMDTEQKTRTQPGADPDISYLEMQRTACFGRCPEYKIELYKDGLVRYTGVRNIADTGIYEKNFGAENIAVILKDFREFRIDTCKDRYENIIPDLPGINFTFKYDTTTKQVWNANFGPQILKELALKVDEAIKVDDSWQQLSRSHLPE